MKLFSLLLYANMLALLWLQWSSARFIRSKTDKRRRVA